MSRQKTKLPVINDCEGCGLCCLHMGYPTYMDPADKSFDAVYWNAMPDDVKQELLDYIASYKKPADDDLDGPCFWFDMETRRCKHHEYRPRVCRDFEVGSKGCRDWREHYKHMIVDRSSME